MRGDWQCWISGCSDVGLVAWATGNWSGYVGASDRSNCVRQFDRDLDHRVPRRRTGIANVVGSRARAVKKSDDYVNLCRFVLVGFLAASARGAERVSFDAGRGGNPGGAVRYWGFIGV